MITWKIRLLADIIGNAFDCECSLLKNDAVDFMIVAKLECLFSTKTARMASLTWHGDWLIQLLTNLFSMHLFPSNDGDLIVHEQLLIPVDHALSTNITGCFRLWMFTVEKCQWTFMIVAKLECLFSTKLSNHRE